MSPIFDVDKFSIKHPEKDLLIGIIRINLNIKNLNKGVWGSLTNTISDELFYEIDNDLFQYDFVNHGESSIDYKLIIFIKEKLPFKLYNLLTANSKADINSVSITATSGNNEEADSEFLEKFKRSSYGAIRRELKFLDIEIKKNEHSIKSLTESIKKLREKYKSLYDELPEDEKLLVEIGFEDDE